MDIEQRVATILERLITARKNARLSQSQAARLLGVAGSTLSHYEAGLRGIDLPVLLRLCEIYDVSPAWVMTGSNPHFDPSAWYEKMKTARAEINESLLKTAELLETLEYQNGNEGD